MVQFPFICNIPFVLSLQLWPLFSHRFMQPPCLLVGWLDTARVSPTEVGWRERHVLSCAKCLRRGQTAAGAEGTCTDFLSSSSHWAFLCTGAEVRKYGSLVNNVLVTYDAFSLPGFNKHLLSASDLQRFKRRHTNLRYKRLLTLAVLENPHSLTGRHKQNTNNLWNPRISLGGGGAEEHNI